MQIRRTKLVAPRRRGAMMIYLCVLWTVLCGFVSLAVDVGRAHLVKEQLANTADAAARYAVKGLGDGTAVSKAIAQAAANKADGVPVVLQNSDVEVGVWNSATHVFTVTNSNPNAVRVTARRTAARGTATQTTFASIIGRTSVDLSAQSVAMIVTGTNTTINVAGGANPWLAGMPNGTAGNWYDTAPANSPGQATGLNITAGNVLQFKFTGAVSYYPGTQPFDPDGNPGWLIDDYYATQHAGAENGIAGLKSPLTCTVGVFLGPAQPNLSGAPASLDFSSAASRDFATLSPALKQPFFIGNGVRADGTTLQNFVVPSGATRLYIGVMDGQQWSDNSGSLSTTVTKPDVISIVK